MDSRAVILIFAALCLSLAGADSAFRRDDTKDFAKFRRDGSRMIDDIKEAIKPECDEPVVPIDPMYYDDIKRIINDMEFDIPTLAVSPVKKTEVKYYLYTRTLTDVFVDSSNPKELNINDKKLVFIIHGWLSNREALWVQDITDATLKNEDVAVIQVDWRKPASAFYYPSVRYVRDVGALMGELLVKLFDEYNMDPDQINLIGHSLGGHVSGFAGKFVQSQKNQTIAKIMALDPAGPLFSGKEPNKRLSKDDAQSVFVLHTDGGKFGFKKSFGATDFFANKGRAIQPGCCEEITLRNITSAIFCSHSRAHRYLIESLKNPGPVGVECESYDVFLTETCDKNTALPFLTDDSTTTGDFYFITDPARPYIRSGRAGASDFIYKA